MLDNVHLEFDKSEILFRELSPASSRRFTGLKDKLGLVIGEGSVVSLTNSNKQAVGVVLYGDFTSEGKPATGFYIIWNVPFWRHDFLYWYNNKDPEKELFIIDDLYNYVADCPPMNAGLMRHIRHAVHYWLWEQVD